MISRVRATKRLVEVGQQDDLAPVAAYRSGLGEIDVGAVGALDQVPGRRCSGERAHAVPRLVVAHGGDEDDVPPGDLGGEPGGQARAAGTPVLARPLDGRYGQSRPVPSMSTSRSATSGPPREVTWPSPS